MGCALSRAKTPIGKKRNGSDSSLVVLDLGAGTGAPVGEVANNFPRERTQRKSIRSAFMEKRPRSEL